MAKFLFKADDAILSHCTCVGAPAMSTGQLDCPWCGCGWMIACSKCGLSFTFAVIGEADVPLVDLGRREAEQRGLTVSDEEVSDWAAGLAEMLEPFEVGDVVVYLDGYYFKVDATAVAFDGYYASHQLDRLPHAEALEDPSFLSRRLGDAEYWFDRERPDRE